MITCSFLGHLTASPACRMCLCSPYAGCLYCTRDWHQDRWSPLASCPVSRGCWDVRSPPELLELLLILEWWLWDASLTCSFFLEELELEEMPSLLRPTGLLRTVGGIPSALCLLPPLLLPLCKWECLWLLGWWRFEGWSLCFSLWSLLICGLECLLFPLPSSEELCLSEEETFIFIFSSSLLALLSVGGIGIRNFSDPLFSFLSAVYFSGFSVFVMGIFILMGEVTELLLADCDCTCLCCCSTWAAI